MRTLTAATAAFTLAFTASAAAQTTGVDRATFFASSSDTQLTLIDFDDIAADTVLDGSVLDGVTITSTGGAIVVTDNFLTSTGANGIGALDEEFFLETETVTFTFDEAITAFAIDFNTFAEDDGAYQASINGGDVVLSLFEVFDGQATGQFIGFTSDTAFTSITISALAGFAYSLDTLFFGAADAVDVDPVPLPAAAWLFGTVLAGGVAARRRRA